MRTTKESRNSGLVHDGALAAVLALVGLASSIMEASPRFRDVG
jgi:hypothetical protein